MNTLSYIAAMTYMVKHLSDFKNMKVYITKNERVIVSEELSSQFNTAINLNQFKV